MGQAYRKQPSTSWPKGWLISLRLLQFLGALIVFGAMGFFVYHLRREKYPVPYEFVALYLIVGLPSQPPPSRWGLAKERKKIHCFRPQSQ